MKRLFITHIALLMLIACNSHPQATTTSVPATSQPHQQMDCSIALKFINEYAEFCMPKSPPDDDSTWIYRNALLTDNFKATYRMLLEHARKDDPELGLGFDPIFDAQDFPDKGFELVSCDTGTGYVSVRGKDWPEFVLVLKVAQQGNKWLVDGSGVINIPVERRAKR